MQSIASSFRHFKKQGDFFPMDSYSKQGSKLHSDKDTNFNVPCISL
jgi:hypothetical protein